MTELAPFVSGLWVDVDLEADLEHQCATMYASPYVSAGVCVLNPSNILRHVDCPKTANSLVSHVLAYSMRGASSLTHNHSSSHGVDHTVVITQGLGKAGKHQ
jgi:hypothetical protein